MWLPKKVYWSPQNIMIDITNNCNLHCIMCRPQILKTKSLVWSYLDFLFVVNHFSPRSISIGATGEPLLNKHISSMIHCLHKKRIKVILNTNGTLLKDFTEDWLQELDLIKISIDAPNETVYKFIRQNENFLQLVDTVKKITYLKKPRVRFEYVIMSQNYYEMSNFIKFCKELKTTCFFRLFEGLQLQEQNVKDYMNVSEIEMELNKAQIVAKDLNVQTNLPDLCKKMQYVRQYYNREKIVDDRRKHICLLPWLQFFVRVDGETCPCCNLLENDMFSVGNIFQISNVWNSQKMIDLRCLFLKKKNYDLFSTCAKCEFLYWKQLWQWTKLIPGWFK